jgi:predicted HicB family RNase H-like nuclease
MMTASRHHHGVRKEESPHDVDQKRRSSGRGIVGPGTSRDEEPLMHLDHAFIEIEAAVDNQVRIGAPELADVATELMTALRPALEKTMLGVIQEAAAEISAQLVGQGVEVRLSEGEPSLVITDERRELSGGQEEYEARVTLRLPNSLKSLIEESATSAGDSMNGWVVDALRTRAGRRAAGTHIEETFEL